MKIPSAIVAAALVMSAPDAQSAPVAAPPAPSAEAVCASIPSVQTLIPCGPLHVIRSQTVDQQNQPVRLNCTAWWADLPD